jgi:hypothetical protein
VKLIGRICPLLVCSILGAQQAAPPAPAAPAPAAQAPAAQAPAAQAQEPENIDRMLSFGLYDWLPNGGPALRGGVNPVDTTSHDLNLPKRPHRAYGAMVTFPAKGNTRIEISYLTLSGSGHVTAPQEIGFFGGTVPKGEPLFAEYSLRHLKLAWNYLTYPNPPQDAKLRIKTLWEFHYVQFKPTVFETVTAPDLPLAASQRIILPAVGLGLEYVPSRHFRMEARGSGMGWPNHSGIGDGEASLVVRVRRLEFFAGMKALYFRTSPKQETYSKGFLWGPDGGIRWVFH